MRLDRWDGDPGPGSWTPGGQRPGPPRRRRLATAGVATLLGLGALRLLGGAGQPGPDPTAPAVPAPSTTAPRAEAPPAPRVRGQLAPELAGTLLYFGGERPRVADLGARTVAPVLPEPLDPPAMVIRQGADPILMHGDEVMVLPARPGAEPARRLPAAATRKSPPGATLVEHWVLRAPDPDQIYLPGFDGAEPGSLAVRRVPLRGGPPEVVEVLPPEVGPVAMVDGGILLRTPAGALELASLPGRRTKARFGKVRLLDALGSRLAFVDDRGKLHLYDLAARSDRVVPRPREVYRWEAFLGSVDTCCQQQAAFSPDGRTLALLTTMDRGTLAGITLVDTATLVVTVLDGSVGPFPTGCLPCLSWRPDGEWLFFMTGQQSPTVVGVWRRGDPAAERIITELDTGTSPTGLVATGD